MSLCPSTRPRAPSPSPSPSVIDRRSRELAAFAGPRNSVAGPNSQIERLKRRTSLRNAALTSLSAHSQPRAPISSSRPSTRCRPTHARAVPVHRRARPRTLSMLVLLGPHRAVHMHTCIVCRLSTRHIHRRTHLSESQRSSSWSNSTPPRLGLSTPSKRARSSARISRAPGWRYR